MWDVQSISGSGYYSITTRKTLQPLAGLHGYSSGEPKSKPGLKQKPSNGNLKTCQDIERLALCGNTVKALRLRISFHPSRKRRNPDDPDSRDIRICQHFLPTFSLHIMDFVSSADMRRKEHRQCLILS